MSEPSDEQFFMVNIRSRTSGLPMNIWILTKGDARHAARIKVQMDHSFGFDIDHVAAVSVENSPQVVDGYLNAEDLDLVSRYIALNRAAILAHWNEETDGAELAHELKALKP